MEELDKTLKKYSLENYVTKRVSSREELRETMITFEVLLSWMPAMDGDQLYYNTDPEGFFIGQLNGKTISCVNLVKYGDNYAFVGTFIVLEEFRGNGYGLALFKYAMESVSSTCNIGINSVLDKVPLYRKWGFVETHFADRRVLVDLMTAAAKLESFNPPSDILVQPAKMVDFDQLSAYDTTIFGAPHHLVLRGLLDGPNTITLAATNQNGDIVGLVAAQKMIVETEGWRITPLYADNGQIARALLKSVLKEMIQDAPERKVAMLELAVDMDPQQTIVFKEAQALAEELNATSLFDMVRMYTNGEFEFPKEKWYSFCAAELG